MKSHVSIEQHQCIVCMRLYDTGALLLNKRLQPSMDERTLTGGGMCPEHEKLRNEGFVACVEAEQVAGEIHMTGTFAHIKKEVWPQLFNMPVPPKGVCYIEPDAMKKVSEIYQASVDNHE